MATVRVQFDELIVEREGLDESWGMRSQLEIPLENVGGVMDGTVLAGEHLAQRDRGAQDTDVLGTGEFVQEGRRVFWGVRDPAKTVAIALTDMQWEWLVVQVEEPDVVIERVFRALLNHTAVPNHPETDHLRRETDT